MKKFWKYLTLTILFLLGLGCVGILYLFFVPTSTLFGLAYITHNTTLESEAYSLDNITEVEIISRSYDVKIVPTEEDQIYAKLHSNAFGFVPAKIEEATLTSTLNRETKTLTFNISEPYGAMFKGSSNIELYVPATQAIDLTIINKNAETSIYLPETGINTLSYKAENGNASILSGKINTLLNLTLNKSDFKITSGANAETANVELNITTGKFDSSESAINNLTVTNNERGVIVLSSCKNIYENLESAGGRIEAKSASLVNITSSETNVYIDEITSGATINLSGSASVSIDKLTGESSNIASSYGKINLNRINSKGVTLRTVNGTINVSNATLMLNLIIEGSGSANVNFAEDAESYKADTQYRSLVASVKSGTLNCKGVENVRISSSANSSININMKDVIGNNLVHNENGTTNIVIAKFSVYKLTTNPEKDTLGNVRVNLSQISEHNGYTNKNSTTTWVNCDENAANGNYLEVSSTTGNITILDTNFA